MADAGRPVEQMQSQCTAADAGYFLAWLAQKICTPAASSAVVQQRPQPVRIEGLFVDRIDRLDHLLVEQPVMALGAGRSGAPIWRQNCSNWPGVTLERRRAMA